jgi:hypothetical protein
MKVRGAGATVLHVLLGSDPKQGSFAVEVARASCNSVRSRADSYRSRHQYVYRPIRTHTVALHQQHTVPSCRSVLYCKLKGKGRPITRRGGPEREYKYSSTHSLTSAPDGGAGW